MSHTRSHTLRAVLLALVCLFMAFPFAQAQTLTLDSCLRAAKLHNTDIQSSQLDIQAADYVRRQVLAKFFPQVSAEAIGFHGLNPIIRINILDMLENASADNQEISQTIKKLCNDLRKEGADPELNLMQHGYNIGATALQPIYAGGRIVNGYRLSKVGIAAAQKQQEITERDVLQQVEETYWLVSGLQEKRQMISAAKALLDTAEYVASNAYEAGLVTSNDLLKIQIKRSELTAKQLQLENGLHLASGLLFTLINAPLEGEPQLEQLPVDMSIDAPILVDTFRVDGRPEAELLKMNIEAEKIRRKMTIGEACPTVALGATGGVTNLFDKNRTNLVGFFTVQIPITMWGEQSYKIKEHNIRIRQAEMKQANLTRQMMLQNEQAYDQLTQSVQLILQFQDMHQLASDNYRLALINYEAGLTTITDLLESQMLLIQAVNDFTDARIQYRSALRRFRALNP